MTVKPSQRWELPPACTLSEFAHDPRTALPLDHERRPQTVGLRVGLLPGSVNSFAWPERIDPSLVAMVSAITAWRQTQGAPPIGYDDELKRPATYKCGLLSAFAARQASTNHVVVRTEAALEAEADWRDRLEQSTRGDEGAADVLLHCVEDIARNVFHHAGGGACGAHIAWRVADGAAGRTWTVAIADTGKGVIRDIQDAFNRPMSAAEALDLAASPGLSGSKQPGQNRGVGLYVVRNVSLRLGGSLRIWTDDHLYASSSRSPDDARRPAKKVTNPWPGTVVEFSLRFDRAGRASRALTQEVLAELEDHGPRSGLPIEFFDEAGPRSDGRDAADDRVQVIPIGEPTSVIAVQRGHAAEIGRRIAELLRLDDTTTIELNGAAVRTISDAYAYALLYDAAPTLMRVGRLRVVAAAPQVRGALLTAMHALRREGLIPTSTQQPSRSGAR